MPSPDGEYTREKWLKRIEPVATMDWSSVPMAETTETASVEGGPAAAARARALLAGRSQVNFGAAGTPVPGRTVLGVADRTTIILGETTAQKVIGGTYYTAACYYGVWTSTPNATRNIHWGASFMCNQPWVRGQMWTGLGSWYGTFGAVYGIKGGPWAQVIDSGWTAWRTYYTSLTHPDTYWVREREDQFEDIYLYLDLYIDGASNPDDIFNTNPGGAGMVAAHMA